jgi:hypothetical protein
MEEPQSIQQSRCSHTIVAPDVPLRPEYRVRITSGPLQGIEGTSNAQRNGSRMLIATPQFGPGVFVQIDPCLVEIRMVDSATPEQTTS